MWTKYDKQKFKDQFNDQKYVKKLDKKDKTNQQMDYKKNKQTYQTDQLLWRFEACHHNKIKQINENSKQLSRHRLSQYSNIFNSFNFLVHLLYILISNFIHSIHFDTCCLIEHFKSSFNRLFNSRNQRTIIEKLNLNSQKSSKIIHHQKFNLKNQFFLILLITLSFLKNVNICYATECFGGIETFEKTAMSDFSSEIKTGGILLQQEDQALTKDCISQCKKQPICLSFVLDYTKFICGAYQYTSGQIIQPNHHLRDKLQTTNTTNFFEKVCYKGMAGEEYRRICGDGRLWAFERILDGYLEGYEDLSIPSVATKEDCAKHCLVETKFNCRSADYDHQNKICRLSREDKRTQPQAWRRDFGSQRDYLENQCAAPGKIT